MPRPTPEVLDGMRPTRNALAAEQTKVHYYARFRAMMADKIDKARKDRSSNIRDIVFVSRYGNHRIQLTAPRDVILQDGTKVKGKPLVAQFKNMTYKVPRNIEDEDAAIIVKKLRAHPAFGIGRDFWEAADAIDESKLHKMASVAQALEADPDVKNAVLDFITATEFDQDVARQEPVTEDEPVEDKPLEAGPNEDAITPPRRTPTKRTRKVRTAARAAGAATS